MNQNLVYVLNHNSICIVNGIIVSNLELACKKGPNLCYMEKKQFC
jgi:hypothetical protein